MNYNFLNHYSYIIVGIMKKSLHKSNSDYFYLKEFDLCRMKFTKKDAIASLNIQQLKDILWYIKQTRSVIEMKKSSPPTYSDMRSAFRKSYGILKES